MPALTADKLNRLISECRVKCEALEPNKLKELDANYSLSFEEHFEFQQMQARAHASGLLSTEAARIVYIALGEGANWAANTDTATKVIVTQLMGELLDIRVKAATR